MRAGYGFVIVALISCSKAGPSTVDPPPPTVGPTTPTAVTVQMTAATLGDDCGGGAPSSPPKRTATAKSDEAMDSSKAKGAKAKRKCEQSSMQLSINSPAGAKAGALAVKKVELFDESGASLGELTSRSPVIWSEAGGAYQPWDQAIVPAKELAVSYALSQPNWDAVSDRRSKTYVLKATLQVGDAEQAVQKDVEVTAPTSLPANVKT
jgi:hypothetical protein